MTALSHVRVGTPGNCGDCKDQREANRVLGIGRHLAAVPDSTFARPDWCGSCNEYTRLTETDSGPSRRCATCHPLAKESA